MDNSKQRILDSAIELIRENGVDGASVRDIAKHAGITTGSIYHHYKNKDAILYDVINQSIHISKKITDNLAQKPSPKGEVLKQVMDGLSQRLQNVDHQQLHLFLLCNALKNNNNLKEDYIDTYTQNIDRTAKLLYQAFDINENPIDKVMASILIAALDGFAVQSILGVLPKELDEMIELFNEFFSKSISNAFKDNNK